MDFSWPVDDFYTSFTSETSKYRSDMPNQDYCTKVVVDATYSPWGVLYRAV
jgi:hypothetical protein